MVKIITNGYNVDNGPQGSALIFRDPATTANTY